MSSTRPTPTIHSVPMHEAERLRRVAEVVGEVELVAADVGDEQLLPDDDARERCPPSAGSATDCHHCCSGSGRTCVAQLVA